MSFLKFSRLFHLTLCCFLSLNTAVYADNKTSSQSSLEQRYNHQLKFSQFSAIEGLSNSTVFDISQDKEGYLWVATEDGLNRFDGKNFQTYRHDSNKANSISDNVIRKVFIDSNNVLWVGTQNGLSRYNRELDNFDNFYHQNEDGLSLSDNVIWDIYQDNFGTLLVSTNTALHTVSSPFSSPNIVNGKKLPKNNINEISKIKNLHFTDVEVKDYSKALKEIKTIYQDENNHYWFGSYDGDILIVNQNHTLVASLHDKNKYNLKINAKTLFDIKKIDGNHWLATDNGIFIIDHHYQVINHINTDDNRLNSQTDHSHQHLLSNHIRAIERYDDNNIWLATNKGVKRI